MKRRRTNSSTESPSVRTTRSNTTSNGTPSTYTPKKLRSDDTAKYTTAAASDDEEIETPTKSQTRSRNRSTKEVLKQAISSSQTCSNAANGNTPSKVEVVVSVDSRARTRGLVSTPNKSRVRETTVSQPEPSPPLAKGRVEITERKKVNGIGFLTPVTQATRELCEEIAEQEPERIIARGIQRSQLDNESEDNLSEDEESEEEEEEDEEVEVEEVVADQEKVTATTGYKNFFHHAAKKKKSLTSNNTLSLLPTLTVQESTSLLASIPDNHATEIKNLHEAHRQQFTQWKFEVDNGYNILLFGYGSKRSLIESFGREKLANDMAVLVINGYFPSVSLDSVLVQILNHINVPIIGDKLNLIQSHLSEPLALLVHSLDSPILRLPKNQQILSTLASNKYITLIASVDHINAPLLFDSLKASRYNFLWHDCTTFIPYRTELSFEETTFLSGGTSATAAVGGLAGIKAVLNNLTSNARSLYLLLLQYQLPLHPEGNDPAGQDQGITFPQLRQLVAKKILPLANPTTLRGALGEFFDHGLVVRNDGRGNTGGRKGKGGGEVLWAPFGKSCCA